MSDLGWRVERACAAAWPANEVREVGGWAVARSGGGTRRANSASASGPGARLDAGVIAAIDALYAEHDQPTLVRVTTLTPGMDAVLDAAGFAPPEGLTHTLALDLLPDEGRGPGGKAAVTQRHAPHERPPTGPRPSPGSERGEVVLSTTPDAPWIAVRRRLSLAEGRGADDQVTPALRLTVPAIFARFGDDAVAYAAVVDGIAVVEAVAVDPAQRRRGLAHRMLATLLDRARDEGASHAALQVMADNAPAIALYRGLGFGHHLQNYHYRRRGR
jgi:ribosomal protein S18 acetylase RimI-like enzyme